MDFPWRFVSLPEGNGVFPSEKQIDILRMGLKPSNRRGMDLALVLQDPSESVFWVGF